MDDLGDLASIFARAAALLARPLSPTALEKEQLSAVSGGSAASKEPRATSRKAADRSKKPQVGVTPALPIYPLAGPGPGPGPADGRAVPEGALQSSILEAVAELNSLQQDLKQKANSPSFRKAAVPKVKRAPERKVMTDQERSEKMEEIEQLEVKLQEARRPQEQVREATKAKAGKNPESGSESDSTDGHGAKARESAAAAPRSEATELQRLAEERVRARRRQERKEQRERERKEAEESAARHAEDEAKARELERLTKERVQERFREERAREQLLREEREREEPLREDRAARAAEELQQLALRRIAEREQAERRLAQELQQREALERRQLEEANEVRAQELRERTRQRVQQYTREQREQMMAEEEAARRRFEEEAEAGEERRLQARISQQRAQARAVDFKQRARFEEEERHRVEEEALNREREKAEAALRERQRRRNWRNGSEADFSPQPSIDSVPVEPGLATAAAVKRNQHPQAQQQNPSQPSHPLPQAQAQPSQIPKPAGQVQPVQAWNEAKVREMPPRVPKAAPAIAPGRAPGRAMGKAGKSPGLAKVARNRGQEEPQVKLDFDAELPDWAPAFGDGGSVQCIVNVFGFEGEDDEDAQLEEHHERRGMAKPLGYAQAPSRCSSRGSNRAPSAPSPSEQGHPSGPGQQGQARAFSQPPPVKSPPWPREARPPSDAVPPSTGSPAPIHEKEKIEPWKQKAIQVKSTDYYLEAIRASRGKGSGAARPLPSDAGSYAEQMRQRASDVQAKQKEEDGARMERGYSALRRVQQRAQAASERSTSVDSAPGIL